MKSLRFVALLAAPLLLAASAVAVACGGDGGGASAEEYFADLQTLHYDMDSRVDTLIEDSGAAFDPSLSDEERLEAGRRFGDGFVSLLTFASDELGKLDPPSEVEDAHNEFLQALGDLRDEAQRAADGAREAESAAELQALFEDNPEFDAVDARVKEACKALQEAASSKGIEVDLTNLQCEG